MLVNTMIFINVLAALIFSLGVGSACSDKRQGKIVAIILGSNLIILALANAITLIIK